MPCPYVSQRTFAAQDLNFQFRYPKLQDSSPSIFHSHPLTPSLSRGVDVTP